MGKPEEIQEGEIVESAPADSSKEIAIFNDDKRSVALTPVQMKAQIKREKEIRAMVTEYIDSSLVEGVDYGKIEMEKNGKKFFSKPTLFKPGSEKFFSLFKIRPVFKKDVETLEMLGNKPGVIAYICELVDQRGVVIGEGRGTAKVDLSGPDFDINKQVKMAEKRAQMDAILRTGGLSDFFTQDLDDLPPAKRNQSTGYSNQGASAPAKTEEPATPKLATQTQKDYLTRLATEAGEEIPNYKLNTMTIKEASDEIAKYIQRKNNK